MYKSLKDISWDVDEPTYRADEALSYSTIARFEREGFNKLDNLFDKLETPSLTFGSAVDSIITGGLEEFEERFMVASFPAVEPAIIKVVKYLFDKYCGAYSSLTAIPDSVVIEATVDLAYQLNWRPETRAKVIKEKGSEYYSILSTAVGKTILDQQTKEDVDNSVRALKDSHATAYYFKDNNPFEPEIVRYYQLKFKATLDGVNYRCMADLIIVDYANKIVYPIDLKTSSHTEWDFFESFAQWRYDIQARLYWRIIRACMDADETFKDFKLADYKFIVVNRRTLTPLVWECDFTRAVGTLTFGKNKQIVMRDPEEIGKELYSYLSSRPKVPMGIEVYRVNDIRTWLNTI